MDRCDELAEFAEPANAPIEGAGVVAAADAADPAANVAGVDAAVVEPPESAGGAAVPTSVLGVEPTG